MKLILPTILAALLAFQDAAATPRGNLALKRGEKLYQTICTSYTTPISFTYNGKTHYGLGKLPVERFNNTSTPTGQQATFVYRLDKEVQIRVETAMCKEYGQVEYTIWFENVGSRPSAVLESVNSVDFSFAGANPTLRGCLGDHVNQYAPYEYSLRKDTVSFRSDGGRATHVSFPYFDLVHGNGGTLIALGWAGTWQASFCPKGNNTHFIAQCCNGFRSVLLPGEKVRTAMVVMLPYTGRNADDATNLWREWFQKYNMPRANDAGDPIVPFVTAGFASDTGLPNSDGSISERFYTWRRTLDRIVYERLNPDFRWFDAGWYFDPAGRTVPTNWWGTVGSWELDTIKWPGHSLRESNEACHKAGMKVLMWFEPERVTMVDALVKNYGYKPGWAISNGRGIITNDIGNPECLNWTLHRITKVMEENAVDLFREDNNSDPGTTWPIQDRLQAEQTQLPRTGITENKAIQGHYALWDSILAYCASRGKCTYIDNCASGGGRNDIESLRRSLPFMRSDADRTTTGLRLAMSSTFNKWIPFHGSSTKESAEELTIDRGNTPVYVTRASWLPVYNLGICFTHDETLDYNYTRATLGEWRRYSHLLTKDFYVLTPFHNKNDLAGWTVFAYHDRDTDESVVQAFRQENCDTPTYTVRLPYVKPTVPYTIYNEDTHQNLTITGDQLHTTGISITLDNPKSSAILHITPQF
ncbi:MAG: alpha-galactosidase [Bacteroidaceae bacterium]|nr:alpha-galactosidase [Bacteroidaceae bacterium]